MTPLQELETKIRQSIPELKDEYEAFEDGSIDRDMITQVGLNHVLEYINNEFDFFLPENYSRMHSYIIKQWNLKSAYLKDQSGELITFLNELK